MSKANALSRAAYLKIAAAADCDPRTVAAHFERSAPVSSAAARAIRFALAELGIPDPHPTQSAAVGSDTLLARLSRLEEDFAAYKLAHCAGYYSHGSSKHPCERCGGAYADHPRGGL